MPKIRREYRETNGAPSFCGVTSVFFAVSRFPSEPTGGLSAAPTYCHPSHLSTDDKKTIRAERVCETIELFYAGTYAFGMEDFGLGKARDDDKIKKLRDCKQLLLIYYFFF